MVKISILLIKIVHTVIFWVLSGCVIYILYSGLSGGITPWTWVAVAALVVESVVLATSGWVCPLTLLAQRQGAQRGEVADIFLPKFLADHLFPVCGTLFAIALGLLAWRLLR